MVCRGKEDLTWQAVSGLVTRVTYVTSPMGNAHFVSYISSCYGYVKSELGEHLSSLSRNILVIGGITRINATEEREIVVVTPPIIHGFVACGEIPVGERKPKKFELPFPRYNFCENTLDRDATTSHIINTVPKGQCAFVPHHHDHLSG